MTRDPYVLLGVGRRVTERELQRAYRQAVLRYHPDRNGQDPAATEHFKQVVQAYRNLRHRRGWERAIASASPAVSTQPFRPWQRFRRHRRCLGASRTRLQEFCQSHLTAVSLVAAAVLALSVTFAGTWSDYRQFAKASANRAAIKSAVCDAAARVGRV